jgi:crotonobetainyl-CoA:carnitine CoA-transferase CaiB-like acyl-CoA transferase
MAGALSGIRIIDFGQYIAGPLTAMMLGDQGAEVIRVDPPTGPMWDTPANSVWNRGKRRISLNLEHSNDVRIARRLIATADVVIENFRPSVMKRLGLGSETMLNANPALIYCSLPGFAADDPRAGTPAWEGVIGAATASYQSPSSGGDPHYTAIPLASNFAAFTACNSIVAALIARARTGRGQRIETPLFDAMFEAFGARGQKNYDHDILTSRVEAQLQSDPLGGGFYRCADTRWVQLLVMLPRHFDWFAERVFPAQWHLEGLADQDRLHRTPELAAELRVRLARLFETRDAAQWEEIVSDAGTPFCVCRTVDEWLVSPQARATRSVIELDDPEYGPMRQPGFPVTLSRSSPDQPTPARPRDADRETILEELETREAPRLLVHEHSNGRGRNHEILEGALDGIRVIDTTQIWAGPTCGRVLAEYGAEVVKINDTSGEVFSHLHVNSGKKSILLNLRKAQGVAILDRLVECADVFMQNFTLGVADSLGIGEAAIRGKRPDVVYASISAYGHEGPRGAHRGWEPVGQAATGMELRMGGDVPMMQPYALCDYGTGLMGAYSVLLALYHRMQTGVGQHVQAALSMTGTLHQTPFMYHYAGVTRKEPRGLDARGSSPLQRLYRARDDWFFLGAKSSQRARLGSVVGLEDCEEVSHDELETRLTERFALEPADHWIARLRKSGMGAAKVATLEEIMEDEWARSHGLSVVRTHEGVGRVRMVGPSPRLSATPLRVTEPAGLPGSDVAEVLADLGIEMKLEGLVADGVIALPSCGAAGNGDNVPSTAA